MAANPIHWQISGDYFENCNCEVVCPCVFSTKPFAQEKPTQGFCEVAMAFHVEQGHYGDITLDGLSAVVIARTPGTMSEGNWTAGVYLDERADERQRGALQTIFTGAGGGPLGALAPFISSVLGVKAVPILYRQEKKRRAVEIPGVMQMAVRATPGLDPEKEVWATNAHPFAPAGVAMAVGDTGSTWTDYGLRWDNSGKNGHYAPIKWANT